MSVCRAGAIDQKLFVEFAKVALQVRENAALFRKLIFQAPKVGINRGKGFEADDLIPEAQT